MDTLPLGILLGLLLSVLLAALAKFLLKFRARTRQLTSLVTQRTTEVQELLTKYQTLFEAFPLGILVADSNGRIKEANVTAERLFGKSFSGKEWQPDDAAQWQCLCPDGTQLPLADSPMMIALNEHRLVDGVPLGVVQPNQETIWINVTAAPLPQKDSGIVVAFHDIRQRMRADLEQRIAAIVFESQEAIIVTDANSSILRVNHTFTVLTGYSEAEVVGQTPRILKSGRHDANFYHAIFESLRYYGVWRGEVWNKRKHGEIYPVWLTITAVKDRAGVVTHYVGTHTDITQRKAAENEIRNLAYYDPLTHLPNRRLLLDRLKQTLANSSRHRQLGALFFIDLDNFKTLNDTLGHEVGDALLKQVAQRLTECVREGDTVARLGGDEFVLMIENLGSQLDEAANLARIVGEKILTRLNQSYTLTNYIYYSTPSIGITLLGDHHETVEEVLRSADLAMYQAKAAGRNTLRFFDHSMQNALMARAVLEADLRTAIHTGCLTLHYQPQVDSAGHQTGVEALLRWQHPEHGWVAPAEILRLAEGTGQMLNLGRWVLETSCNQLAKWSQQSDYSHLTLAVNISANHFKHPQFADDVLAILNQAGADPSHLILELPEPAILDDQTDAVLKITTLKTHGIRFALDNFGTGYCSLLFLRRLPVDQLKLAPSFVQNLIESASSDQFAAAFLTLVHNMGLTLLAEGVETEEQKDFLVQNGCHALQGHLFGYPGPAESVRI